MRSVLTALCLFGTAAHAVPAQFTHQGRLLDADGVPLDGEATITFRVTSSETGGDVLWEDALNVDLTAGFYAAILGADEDDNPLDTDVLSQAPVWLELQLDGEPPMFPRSAINAVPYATMATVAEEVSGGPVDASQIAVDGTPVVNELGEWVGPTPSITWSEIEGIPDGFSDDADSDSFADLGASCIDGDIAVWDGISMEWNCDLDRDTLADIACTEGQIIAWSDESTGFVCANDADTVLTEDEVDAMVADNGYAMESEVFSSSFLDLTDVPDGLLDGDDDTQLTEEQVDAMVADNGYAMAADAFSGLWTSLTGVPDDIADGDDVLTEDDVDTMVADNGYAMESEVFSSSFLDLTDVPDGLLDGDDDTQLTEEQVDAMVADNGYALAADAFSGLWSALTGIPEDLADGDDNTDTLQDLACESGEIAIQTEGGWGCSTLVEQLDGDSDGTMVWADCDDGDSTKGAIALDGDCDGHLSGVDCDDEDSASTHTAEDADCDGTLTSVDCDDFDPDSTIVANDGDCDGVLTVDDCDDGDDSVGDRALDADCDGTPTESDCDDSDPAADSWGSEGCPAPSCAYIRSQHPTFENGTYAIRPSDETVSHNFYCDLLGTHTTAGSLHLVSAYAAYSAKALASCGGEPVGGDADCSPDAGYEAPYYQGEPREQVQFDWRDADNNEVSNEWLTAYSEGISEIGVDGIRHFAYDADSASQYKVQFSYVDGSSNSDDNRGSNWGPNATWREWTEEGKRMMLGGQHNTEPATPKIPKILNVTTFSSGNWGWHIRFTEAVNDSYGIWLH